MSGFCYERLKFYVLVTMNAYTLMTTKGTHEGQRVVNNQRVFTLTRSAWAGAQRYVAASCLGDSSASWDMLKHQIFSGLDMTLAGNPWRPRKTANMKSASQATTISIFISMAKGVCRIGVTMPNAIAVTKRVSRHD